MHIMIASECALDGMAEVLRTPVMVRKIVCAMAIPSSSGAEKSRSRRSKQSVPPAEPQSWLRTLRIKRGLTQTELARLAGMHRNSIRKLEDGTTREVNSENASPLAAVLKVPVAELGLRVRAATEARSIRIRRLSLEQRQIVDELLSLPPEDYVFIRSAIERLRKKRAKKPRRGGRK
jgi:transcriptional regulator with XRE-family HTH domain